MPNFQSGFGPENLDPNFLIAAEPEATEAAAPHIVTGEAPYSPLLVKAAEPEATDAAAPHIVTSGATSAVNIKGL